MAGLRILCGLTAAICLLAQTAPLPERIRRALQGTSQLESALSALAQNHYAEVDRILAASPGADKAGKAETLSLRADVAFLAGDMAKSTSLFADSAKLGPLADSDAFTFSMAWVKLNSVPQARVVLADLSRRNPKQPLYLYWLGRLDYAERRYEEAVRKLQEAAELDPNSARTWDSLGLAFDMQGRAEPALEALQKAAVLNRAVAQPSPWPPNDLGSLLFRMGKFAEAKESLKEALRIDPNHAPAHYYLGRALEKLGEENEAVSEYKKSIAADMTFADPCYSLAMLYRKLGREAESEEMFAEFKRKKQAAPGSGSVLR